MPKFVEKEQFHHLIDSCPRKSENLKPQGSHARPFPPPPFYSPVLSVIIFQYRAELLLHVQLLLLKSKEMVQLHKIQFNLGVPRIMEIVLNM